MTTIYCQECGSEDAHIVVIEDSAQWTFRLCNSCEDALEADEHEALGIGA